MTDDVECADRFFLRMSGHYATFTQVGISVLQKEFEVKEKLRTPLKLLIKLSPGRI